MKEEARIAVVIEADTDRYAEKRKAFLIARGLSPLQLAELAKPI